MHPSHNDSSPTSSPVDFATGTPQPTELTKRVGGSFLLEAAGEGQIFIPEGQSETQREFREATIAFIEGDVLSRNDEVESGAPEVQRELLKKCCELGFAGVEVAEEHGGLGLDFLTAMIIAEEMASQPSFSVSFGAHSSIGMLPVVYFGSEETKAAWLPDMVSGDLISCYALTEPNSGSDALAARAKAVLNDAGTHYLLTGTKQFISNGGFADVGVVFAQVDGTKFTGFLVDLRAEGHEPGPPEHKMGIRGSVTTTLNFDNTPVPVENVLGEIGAGHRIAFNILNIGRMKLAAASIGGSRIALDTTVAYAKERQQFGTPLADFPAIRTKLARIAAVTYAGEAMVYRTAGDMERALHEYGDEGTPAWKGIEEFAAEAAMCKVYCSETTMLATDEGVQIHGGYGYINEYPIERAYRDARINRIFEGTNEINRMLVPGTLLKRALQGRLDLMSAAGPIQSDIDNANYSAPIFEGLLAEERTLLHLMQRRVLYTTNAVAMKLQAELEKRQEVLMPIADMMIQFYAADSAVRRALQTDGKNDGAGHFAHLCAQVITHEAWEMIDQWSRQVLWHISGSKGRTIHAANLNKWSIERQGDLLGLHQELGALLVDMERYPRA